MTLLDPSILAFLAAVAIFTGFVKAGVPALGGLISAAMALVFPPKDALGITLLYLLAGDVVAVSLYWRQAHWSELGKMLPSIFIGIGLGALALQFLDNESLGPVIGALILFLVAMEPLRPYITAWAMRRLNAVRYSSGIMAGVATTIGNAAGPILTLYFLLLKIDKNGFIGTAAVFFLTVNLTKVPVYAYLGVLKDYYLLSYLATVPLVLLGAYAGRRFLVWIPQQWFNRIALIMTGVAGLWLLLRAL